MNDALLFGTVLDMKHLSKTPGLFKVRLLSCLAIPACGIPQHHLGSAVVRGLSAAGSCQKAAQLWNQCRRPGSCGRATGPVVIRGSVCVADAFRRGEMLPINTKNMSAYVSFYCTSL